MPLSEAIYLSSTDKIYGVMSNYVLKFNASTGLKEASAKVASPCYGPMRIVGHGSNVYVASANDYSVNNWWDDPSVASNREIWTVDGATLAITNTLQIGAKFLAFVVFPDYAMFGGGPRAMKMVGDYLYFQYTYPAITFYWRIDVTNPATYDINYTVQSVNDKGELFDVNGSNIWQTQGYTHDIEQHDSALSGFTTGNVDVTPLHPVCAVYSSVASKVYALTGTETLIRCDDFTAHSYTSFNLGTITANVSPMRMRVSPLDGNIYIACQNQDVIIIWNPSTDTGIAKTGFTSPVDVVFTASKAFAVQSSVQSLKEIV